MKKFWNIFKKLLLVAGIASSIALFALALSSAVKKQKTLVCNAVQVAIDFETGVHFISTHDVVAKINYLSGGAIVGKPLSAVDFKTLESELNKNPYVAHTEVYADHTGIIHVQLTQKQPVLRIINNNGVGYYLSDKNEQIPLSDNFTAHVPIAIGVVETHEDLYGDSIVLSELYQLAMYVRSDTFLNAMLDHIYVDERGDLVLYPKWGGHKVKFGRAGATMREKFERLKTFYREGFAKVGWEKYEVVNLQFDGQVVCERKRRCGAVSVEDSVDTTM